MAQTVRAGLSPETGPSAAHPVGGGSFGAFLASLVPARGLLTAAVVALAFALPAPAAVADDDAKSASYKSASYLSTQRDRLSYPVPVSDTEAPLRALEPTNWFQDMVRWAVELVSTPPRRTPTGTSARLSSAFADLEDYEEVYTLAAGWNGDRFQQYRLGLMFETGNGAVSPNLAAAYYFYSLSAAQNFGPAADKRITLLQGNVPQGDLDIRDRMEVYLKFVETYIFGGPDAQFRLGEVLQGDFFNNRFHDQDRYDADDNFPRRRLVHAYAAFLLAEQGGVERAAEARQDLVRRENMTQYDQVAGEEVAEEWAALIGIGDPDNPFRLSEALTEKALSRGNAFQDRRSDEMSDNDDARSWLLSGRSFEARGDIRRAKIAYETAISLAAGSRAGLDAQQALQGLTTTCSAAPANHPDNPLGRIWKIDLEAQQFALRALGYYEGPIDGDPGPMTRSAVRNFLASLNVDQQAYLDGPQIVELICNAAQLRGHAASQNMLGLMYAEGIGVVREEELALYWFTQSAQQRFPSAVLNVGKMYAQERGLVMRGHPQNCAIAKSYMREAADLGHPQAKRELSRVDTAPACKSYGGQAGG